MDRYPERWLPASSHWERGGILLVPQPVRAAGRLSHRPRRCRLCPRGYCAPMTRSMKGLWLGAAMVLARWCWSSSLPMTSRSGPQTTPRGRRTYQPMSRCARTGRLCGWSTRRRSNVRLQQGDPEKEPDAAGESPAASVRTLKHPSGGFENERTVFRRWRRRKRCELT